MLFNIAYSKDLVKEDLRQIFNDLELEYETAASERFETIDVEVEEVKPTKPVKSTKKSKKTTKKVEKKETEEKKEKTVKKQKKVK